MKEPIPVFEPEITQEDRAAVMRALEAGEISGSGGKNLEEFERTFAEFCECRHGVATTSGTTALHLASQVAGFGPGDEVLVSTCTNIGTVLGLYHLGAVPVPVDCESKTWNLDLELLESLITAKTKGIIPVHFLGHPVDMDRLMPIARKHRLVVLEDAAEAHGAKIRSKTVGSHGDMVCFSFYANKVITTGEGGMVVTNDDVLAEQLRLFRNLGFTQPRFRHEVAAYNFRMTAYQAALGRSQLARIGSIVEAKRRVASLYQEALAGVRGLQLPCEESWAYHVYWMYGVRVLPEAGLTRDDLAHRLRSAGIDTRTFFCPMDQQPCFSGRLSQHNTPCQVAAELWQSGLLLPSSHTLKEGEIARIAENIRKTLGS
jgi:perosamine synthetase